MTTTTSSPVPAVATAAVPAAKSKISIAATERYTPPLSPKMSTALVGLKKPTTKPIGELINKEVCGGAIGVELPFHSENVKGGFGVGRKFVYVWLMKV